MRMTLLVAYQTVSIVMYASEPRAHVESWVHHMAIASNICVSKTFGVPGGKYVGVSNPRDCKLVLV